MMKELAVSMLIVPLLVVTLSAKESFKKLNDEGNDKYQQGEFEEAQKLLEEAKNEKPSDPTVNYNIGSVYHQEGDYDRASESYLNAAYADDSAMRAHAHYNIGNTEFRKGDYEKAVEAYKKSLGLDPDDLDTKYNLEVALKMLEQQQQQQSECQDPQDQEEQDEQEQNQDQQQNDEQQQQQEEQQQDQQENDQQQEQEQQQQQEQEQQQQEQEQEQEQQEQQQQSSGEQSEEEQQQQQQMIEQPVEMSEEDAERLLNAATGNDREVLRKLVRKKVPASGYQGKDW
jgi:Ca-activated chloride channel family protein